MLKKEMEEDVKRQTIGSIEAKAVPEWVDGKQRFRGTFRLIVEGRDPVNGHTLDTYTSEIEAMTAAQEMARLVANSKLN